jgi:hypothetical protein
MGTSLVTISDPMREDEVMNSVLNTEDRDIFSMLVSEVSDELAFQCTDLDQGRHRSCPMLVLPQSNRCGMAMLQRMWHGYVPAVTVKKLTLRHRA